CKEGTQTCAGGKWGQCQNESIPQNETCGDNKDNDCNGRVDELASCNQGCTDGTTRACYTGPAGTKDVGVCKGGGQLCKNNKWEACVGEIVPTTEICGDGKDNNCNNQVDDNCGVCRPGSQEACYSGTTGCTKNGNVYTCNTPCSAGTRTCKADGQWGPCTGETTPAAKEICGDNIDNDCNNFIDDNCNTKLHQPCQTDTDCGTGNRCVRASNVLQICVQECTNDPTICNKNPKRKVCRAYTITDQGQQLSMCAEEASSGQSCDFSKSIMCKSNLVCDNGSCRAATYVNEGEICDSTAATPVLCALGLTCVSFGNGRPNVCLKLCSVANPVRCSRSSFSCMPFQTGGQVGDCIQTTCTQNSDCVFTNTPHECVSTSSGGKLCVSSTSPGTATFGNICDNNTIRCQAGLTCLATSSTAANGFCSQDCTTSGTCPTGGTCTQVSTTQKMCLIPCTTTCSNTQFTCQTIGQLGNFCFPN
ncbi:MAG TPA: hypothetical protein DCE42_06230, partial [Myxococcales bacterium]|nr:hypothetical protein [Myxococcales bacterium]